MRDSYRGLQLEATTKPSFVSGPPLGENFLSRYRERQRLSRTKQQLTFEGLLLTELAKRQKRRHRDPSPPIGLQNTGGVSLEYSSDPATLGTNSFWPNGRWYGEKATGLLQPPAAAAPRPPVTLDYLSPAADPFTFIPGPVHPPQPGHALPKRWRGGNTVETDCDALQGEPAGAGGAAELLPERVGGVPAAGAPHRDPVPALQPGGTSVPSMY